MKCKKTKKNLIILQIYAIGGINHDGDTQHVVPETGTSCDPTVEEYDLETRTWELTSRFPEFGLKRYDCLHLRQ